MWQLECARDDSLPRLAWCAALSQANGRAVVRHGPWIEATDSAFVEGAWSGAYPQMGFAHAATFTGSGGLLTPGGLLLATATNSVEPLFMLQSAGTLYCSNSLPLVLASAGDDIDPEYRYYDVDLTSMAFGLRRRRRRIPTLRRNSVWLYFYCNCLVDERCSRRVYPKPLQPSFQSYAEYRSLLGREVASTIDNASHVLRGTRYTPLSTISTGYDSAAAAVLARDAGCNQAITLHTACDTHGEQLDDSGAALGRLLGLTVTEFDPLSYLSRDDLPEAEFVATGGGGGSVVFTGAETSLSGKLLVTGNYGGESWERIDNKGGPGMVTFDSAGADLTYFRLRVGFGVLPVGAIGYSAYTSIQTITNSAEMRPWCLERDQYDRPIPRRIVEEAGVAREMFGQTKKAVARTLKYCNPYPMADPDLQRVMAPASYEHFRRWAARRRLYRNRLDRLAFWTMRKLYRANLRLIRDIRMQAAARRSGLPLPAAPWLPIRFRKARTEHRLLFHWGMEQLKMRYAATPVRETVVARADGDSCRASWP